MQTITIDGKWEKELILGEEFLKHLSDNNIKTVALFASVQFLALDTIRKQITDAGITIKETKAKRTHAITQILGCDAYHDSYEEDVIGTSDALIYIGDGMFHPKALLLAQIYKKEIKPVLIWNPIEGNLQIIDRKDIEKQIQKTKANLKRFVAAKTIGLMVTTKPGQSYINSAYKLKAKLEKEGKKCYVFVDDTLNIQLLENYPFIEAWINTACPRIGTDDLTTIRPALINIREAVDPIGHLEKFSH
ncbi:MAG: 2-(3-amino-3-carboxypropyl)histidine synthase [Candidatus Woesearchaeota archaeon]|jgi:2-(3-amino-3-carboxypropyl)histidine synthase